MRKRKLFIGTVEDLFRDETSDDDDEYLNLVATKFESEQNYLKYLDEKDDIYISMAADDYESHLQELKRVPDSLKHLLMDSKTEIEKKRLVAMVKIRNKEIGIRKCAYVSEYFYHVVEWPPYAIKLLFDKDFMYMERMQLAVFFLGNGLRDGQIASTIFKIYNKFHAGSYLWNKRFQAFEEIFGHFEKHPSAKANYWYFDIQTNRNLYLNGLPKK